MGKYERKRKGRVIFGVFTAGLTALGTKRRAAYYAILGSPGGTHGELAHYYYLRYLRTLRESACTVSAWGNPLDTPLTHPLEAPFDRFVFICDLHRHAGPGRRLQHLLRLMRSGGKWGTGILRRLHGLRTLHPVSNFFSFARLLRLDSITVFPSAQPVTAHGPSDVEPPEIEPFESSSVGRRAEKSTSLGGLAIVRCLGSALQSAVNRTSNG